MKNPFILILLGSSLLYSSASPHRCAFDDFKKTGRTLVERTLESTNRYDSWGEFRITVDYSNLSSGTVDKMEKYIDASLNFFKNSLSIHQLINPIEYTSDYDSLACDYSAQNLYGKTLYTDFIVIYSEEYNSEDNYVAYSTVCGVDSYTMQPVIGVIVINNYFMASIQKTALLMCLLINLPTP